MRKRLVTTITAAIMFFLILSGCSIKEVKGTMLKITKDNVVGEWEAVGFLDDGDYITIDDYEEQTESDYSDELIINEDGTGSIKVEQEGTTVELTDCTWEMKEDDEYILYFYLNDEDNTEIAISSNDFKDVSDEPSLSRLVDNGDASYSICYKRK